MVTSVMEKLAVRSTKNYSGLQLERLEYQPALAAVFNGEVVVCAHAQFGWNEHGISCCSKMHEISDQHGRMAISHPHQCRLVMSFV